MKPGRPRRGESVPSAKVKTWLDPACLEHVQRRGGSCYVRQLILTDLPTRKEPVSEQATRPGKSKFEVVIPAELKPMVMEAGGSAYVRHLVENETERRTMNEHEMNLDAIAKCIEAQCMFLEEDEAIPEMPNLLKVAEFQRIARVSKTQAYNLLPMLPKGCVVRIGRQIRLDKRKLLAWLSLGGSDQFGGPR